MIMYANVVTEGMVLVVDISTGEEVKFFKTDNQFAKAVELVKAGKEAEVFKLDTKSVVTSFFKAMQDEWEVITVSIENGVGFITLHSFNDMKVPLADVITKKILSMAEQGFPCKPLVNFLGNLYENPSKTAIDELYGFIEACDLPITEDGYFIAYKMVKSDYMDIHSGTVRNQIGDAPAMPRAMVDADRNRTCSQGLHFCSKSYLSSFGSSRRDSDRCMLVKINPADVVAIPADYNNAKGRAWTYEVVGEVESGWRATLPQKDYTDKAVVSAKGKEIVNYSVAAHVKEIIVNVLHLDDDAYFAEAIKCDFGIDLFDQDAVLDALEEEFGIDLFDTDFEDDAPVSKFVEAVELALTPRAPVVAKMATVVAQKATPVLASGFTADFEKGYTTGFTHGKSKLNQMALPANTQYSDGYARGYKDGKNKKARLIK
jgi:acyl carrier protein